MKQKLKPELRWSRRSTNTHVHTANPLPHPISSHYRGRHRFRGHVHHHDKAPRQPDHHHELSPGRAPGKHRPHHRQGWWGQGRGGCQHRLPAAWACCQAGATARRGASFRSCTLRVQVLKPGSSVVTTNIELADEATGKLLAQGTHIKVRALLCAWVCVGGVEGIGESAT